MKQENKVAALVITARQRDTLLAALREPAAQVVDYDTMTVLETLRQELEGLGLADSGIVLPFGGKGLRLIESALATTGRDPAFLAAVRAELESDRGRLADNALVTVVFDPRDNP